MARHDDTGYTVLARRYRPSGFDEVVGQEHVAITLRNGIRDSRVGHAYLFAGPRGVGKTSMARLLAKALNCAKGPTETPCGGCELCTRIQDGTDTDVIEMDAASNRSVDDARALREGVRYAPLRARFKIYIVDEAHMLTREAFNALLKTLEEPPPHVKFVFATTELHKLPDTIVSRCQQFDFRRITTADIVRRLKQVVASEKLKVDEAVLASIARAARGSMRDAESILDQLVAFKPKGLTSDDVTSLLGAARGEHLDRLVAALQSADPGAALTALDAIFASGVDSAAFCDQLLEHARTLMAIKACGPASSVVDLPDALRAPAEKQAAGFSLEAILYFLQMLLEARQRIKDGAPPRVVLEASLVKMAKAGDLVPLAEVLKSVPVPAPAAAAPPPPKPAARPAVEERPPVSALSDAPDEPAAPAEALPVSGDASVQNLAAHWHKVVAEVKEKSKVVGALIEVGRPTKLSGDEIEFTLPPDFRKFHLDQLDAPRNRQIVEAALHSVFGRRFGIHATLHRAGGGAPGSPEGGIFKTSAPAARDLTDHPSVRKVLDAFPGSKVTGIE